MIVLFTDFGLRDSYVGQMHAVLTRLAPDVPVIDLLHSVPHFDIRCGAYLLPAYAVGFSKGTVFVCVVDPGVGGSRRPVMLSADGRWFVGPDNGLFSVLAHRAENVSCYEILWRPEMLSDSFHGRDLFAPAAAMLAQGGRVESRKCSLRPTDPATWPGELAEVIYIDHFGNAATGLRAETVDADRRILVHGETLSHTRTFSEARPGSAFWYGNASGLVEIAVNRGSAARELGIEIGDPITVCS